MLTEQQLDEYLKVFDARMQGVTDQYLRMIGEHLKAIGELTPSDVHRLTQLKQMHTNVRKIKREIAKAANLSMADIETAFEAAAASNERFMREYYEKATGHDVSGSTERSEPLKRIIEAQANVTDQAMRNLSNTTVVESAYRDVIDVAVQTVQGGVADYKSAIRSAMTAAAKNGLRVEYESGYTRRLDSAVRQNVLDGVRSLNNDMLKQLGKEYGADGIEISAHMLCAEDHLPYQGRQFTNEQFERIQANLHRPFGQWNCKHTIFPIIMGVSVQALDDETISHYNEMSTQPITIDGKTKTRYEWSQVQRKIETAVREQKDIATVAKASGDRKAERKARANVSAFMDYYDKVSNASKIQPEYGRMAVQTHEQTQRLQTASHSGIINLHGMSVSSAQFGRKCGKHMSEWGLDPSSEVDRQKFLQITDEIRTNADEVRRVQWLFDKETGKRTVEVSAYIKGNDVVLVDDDDQFITTMKDGTQNSRVKGGKKV